MAVKNLVLHRWSDGGTTDAYDQWEADYPTTTNLGWYCGYQKAKNTNGKIFRLDIYIRFLALSHMPQELKDDLEHHPDVLIATRKIVIK